MAAVSTRVAQIAEIGAFRTTAMWLDCVKTRLSILRSCGEWSHIIFPAPLSILRISRARKVRDVEAQFPASEFSHGLSY